MDGESRTDVTDDRPGCPSPEVEYPFVFEVGQAVSIGLRALGVTGHHVTMRFSHQESVPVEGRDPRRWPSLQRVVRDFERGPSEQAPAKRHSALGRLAALTCRDA